MTTNVTVTDGTYIAFIVLMFVGAALGFSLCNANKVIRSDGTHVVLMKNPSWKTEFIGLYETLRLEPYIVFLFPFFWSSNWFSAYQHNGINSLYFDTRTKALNSLLYWISQIFGATVFGNCLDSDRFRRTFKAKVALIVLFMLTMIIWGGGYAFAKTYTRESLTFQPPADWTDSGYVGKMFLYMFYGFFDAAWQCCAYWLGFSFLFINDNLY